MLLFTSSLEGLAVLKLLLVILVSTRIRSIIIPIQIKERKILSLLDSKFILNFIFPQWHQITIAEVDILQVYQVIKSITNPSKWLVENTSLHHVNEFQRLLDLMIAQDHLCKCLGDQFKLMVNHRAENTTLQQCAIRLPLWGTVDILWSQGCKGRPSGLLLFFSLFPPLQPQHHYCHLNCIDFSIAYCRSEFRAHHQHHHFPNSIS